jgi:hypothetical protein
VHVAWLETLSATPEHPVIADVPSLKATDPFAPGLPAEAATVAVKVTLWPKVLGLLLLVRLVVVVRVASVKCA